jgi:hypothetical protein
MDKNQLFRIITHLGKMGYQLLFVPDNDTACDVFDEQNDAALIASIVPQEFLPIYALAAKFTDSFPKKIIMITGEETYSNLQQEWTDYVLRRRQMARAA